MSAHKSDSTVQQMAEKQLLLSLQESLGARFVPDAALPITLGVKPDGVDLERRIVAEVYARVGALKGAQLHKVKADLLKLVYLRHMLGSDWRVILCFGSKEAAAFMLGKSWAASAAQEFGIEVMIQELPENQRAIVVAAQERQRMVNWE
jgi:hypothetical protein